MIYRSQKLLASAKHAPHCMRCGGPNFGNVVMAHSNQLRDGKGTGIKAHDYRVAALCHECHTLIDAGKAWSSREHRIQAWEEAHRATIAWLFESGIVGVV